MSKHAKPTLVRFFRADEDMQMVLVRDWEVLDGWARFTLPVTSSVGSSLIYDGLIGVRVVVLSSEEVEWHIDRVTRDPGEYRITCQSQANHTKKLQLSDEWVLANFASRIEPMVTTATALTTPAPSARRNRRD